MTFFLITREQNSAYCIDCKILKIPRDLLKFLSVVQINFFITKKWNVIITISGYSVHGSFFQISQKSRFLKFLNKDVMFELQEVPEAELRLLEKIAELEDKNADLLDKYRRSLADFENLRNRNRVHSFELKHFYFVISLITVVLFNINIFDICFFIEKLLF